MFDRGNVIDWDWRPDGTQIWGEFTTRVILAREGLDAATELGLPFANPPIPADW